VLQQGGRGFERDWQVWLDPGRRFVVVVQGEAFLFGDDILAAGALDESALNQHLYRMQQDSRFFLLILLPKILPEHCQRSAATGLITEVQQY
jgi:hypothetical protein